MKHRRTILMPIIWALSLLIFLNARLNAAQDEVSRRQIEKDLALQVVGVNPVIKLGDYVQANLVLRNQSTGTAHPVVPGGDGSEVGWREPYVYFTATINTGEGGWQPVPIARIARCGDDTANWQRGACVLQPGADLSLRSWFPALDFRDAGRVRLVAHYSYRAGKNDKKAANQNPVTGLMAGVPAFELVSAPVEFNIVKALDLRLTAKARLRVGESTKLSDCFDIRLVNRFHEPVKILSRKLGAPPLSLEIEGQLVKREISLEPHDPFYALAVTLKPNEEVAVLGPASSWKVDGTWEYPAPDAIRVRAIFRSQSDGGRTVIQSNWIEVKVSKE